MLEKNHYIWRGQRCDDWRLQSTLDRALAHSSKPGGRLAHLQRFQMAVRGRRGTNPPAITSENDWWALGQHYGLATPLLDWTTSPFVAAYFAFAQKKKPQTKRRVIWALSTTSLRIKSAALLKAHTGEGRAAVIDFVRPLSDENSRLVSQGGLFTKAPDGMSLEDWVMANFQGILNGVLLKITVPDSDREEALMSLTRMNINHRKRGPKALLS